MVVKINGKPFDWESNDLYEGENPSRFDWKKKAFDYGIFAALMSAAYFLYPYMVSLLEWFFAPLMRGSGWM